MTRIEYIRTMPVEEMADIIVGELVGISDYCNSDCDDVECLHPVECCVRWLKSKVGERNND